MNNKPAFTLIELMVIISLLALIFGLTITRMSFFDHFLMRIEVEKLMSACLFMQQLAIATNEEKYLTFDMQKNEYQFAKHHEKVSSRIYFGFIKDIKGPPGSPHNVITKAITFPEQRICFYPTGIISSGTVYLTDENRRLLYALSNAVSQVSYLRMYCYDGGWKVVE